MSNFAARLDELMERATDTPWQVAQFSIQDEKDEANTYLIAYLVNHATAIRDLVRAAECIRYWHDSGKEGMVVSTEHVIKLWEALAKLEEI